MTERHDPTEDTPAMFAEAEGVYQERLTLLLILARRYGIKRTGMDVIRWLVDRGGIHTPIEATPGQIARSYWVRKDERTVQRWLARWESLGIVARQYRQDRGKNLPSRYQVDWSTVLQHLARPEPATMPTDASGAVQTPRWPAATPASEAAKGLPAAMPAPFTYTGTFRIDDPAAMPGRHSTAAVFQPAPTSGCPGDIDTTPGDKTRFCHHSTGGPGDRITICHHPTGGPGDKTPRLPGMEAVAPARMHAAARAVCCSGLGLVLNDVDVVQTAREARWEEVRDLATEAGRTIWPPSAACRAIPEAGDLAVRWAAVLALMLFDRRWLLDAAAATRRAVLHPPRQPISDVPRYLAGLLRNTAIATWDIGPWPGTTEHETRAAQQDWFARLHRPLHAVVEHWIKPLDPYPEPGIVEQRPLARTAMTAEDRDEERATIAAARAAITAAKPRSPEGSS